VPATPFRDTPTVDQEWDGPANEARLSNDAGRAVYERMYAWRNPDRDPDTKAAYSLPHHEVLDNGRVGAANVRGCRNALARLPQSNIPRSDHDAVESHLNRHLDRANPDRAEEFDDTTFVALRVQTSHRVWAIDSRTLAALDAMDGMRVSAETVVALEAQRRGGPGRSGDVATVPLKGVLMPEVGGLFALLFGGGGLQAFQAQLAEAVNDPEVGVIVMDIDSPGGLVDQIPETAAQIRAARAIKPIVAVANTQAASAAYWLASQADEIVVTPSGEAGSIGVYQLHRDLSAQHEMKGIVPTLVSAGKYKVEGNPYQPLGEEARAAMQADVDDYYRMFTGEVAKGRGVTREDIVAGYGEGRCLHAKQAVSAGIADRVETLSDTVRRLTSPAGRAALDRRRAEEVAGEPEVAPVTYTPDERTRLLTVLA
jgi:signal peptide peptidase SppA